MYLSVRLNSKEPMRKNIPVAKELIERILQAGMMAPYSKNRQPWKFIVASGVITSKRGFNTQEQQRAC